MPMSPLEVAILGTDTGVGKTLVVSQLVWGLRALGRTVWVHKPVACGGWSEGQAEDGRALAELAGDGQDPSSICPFQYSEPASPHLAARQVGKVPELADYASRLAAVRGQHDLIVEGVGGLLAPLTTARETIADLISATGLSALIVTRPDLGTLNHTALTVNEARRRRIPLLGLVLSRARPDDGSLAVRSAARELAECTGLPLIADIAYQGDRGVALAANERLAAAVLQHHASARSSRAHAP